MSTTIRMETTSAGQPHGPEPPKKQILAGSHRGPTGPRTQPGKERSCLNAVKHGIFSRAFLVKGESPAEYRLLLRGMQEYFQPQGTPEETLVETLTTLIWRQRRPLKAESAEIARRIEFLKADNLQKMDFEVQHREKWGHLMDGMLHQCSNPLILDRAIELLLGLRESFEIRGFRPKEDVQILRKLYGFTSSEDLPEGFPKDYMIFGLMAGPRAENSEDEKWPCEPETARSIVLGCVDGEVKRLERLKKSLEEVESKRRPYNAQALLVPKQEVLEPLQRYEAHLSREFDRTLNRLERLQRMRLGQPVPPPVKVELSS